MFIDMCRYMLHNVEVVPVLEATVTSQLGGRGAQLTWPVAISRIEAEPGDTAPVYTQPHVDLETYQVSGVYCIELQTKVRGDFSITEKGPT